MDANADCRSSSAKRLLPLLFTLATFVPASAQTTLVSDTFNRANSGAMGTADTGQAWTTHAGSPNVQSNTARLGGGFALASLNTGSSTGAAQVRVTTISDEFWLILRLSDGANYWRFGRWRNEPYQLQQVQNNALGSPVLQTPATRSPAAGDLIRCNLLAAGLECSVNGTVVVSTTNTFLSTSTRVGISGYLATAAVLDDLLVTSAAPTVTTPDISLGISGPASGFYGATLAWTAAVQNVGTATATGVELRITQPSGQPNLTFTGATCTLVTTYYQCLLGNIAAQATVNVVATLTNAASAPSVIIAGTVPTVAGETNTTQNSASRTTTLSAPPTPDISLGITGPATGFYGATLAWTATVQNVGTGSASGVELRITQPSGQPNLTFTGATCTLVTTYHQCLLGNIAAQGSVSVVATLTNTASAASVTIAGTVPTVTGETNTSQNSASRTTTLSAPPTPDMSLGIQGPATGVYGATLAWTATVQNVGTGTGSGVELHITQPTGQPNLTFTGATCTLVTTYHRCVLGNLAAQASANVVATLTNAASVPSVTIAGTVPTVTGETNTSQNSASMTTTLSAPIIPDISLGIQGPSSGLHGATLAWTATVQNIGNAAATGVELRITQPSGQPNLTFTGATCTLVSTYHQCLLGNIAAQGSVNVGVTLTNVASAASVMITGTVPAVASETNTSQNSASITTTLSAPPTPDISLGIQGPATGVYGATLAWTAAVQNVGTATATNVELRITQPSGQPNLTFTGASCTLVSTYHQCLLGNIAAQGSVSVVATLTNTASAASVTIAGTVPTVSGETNTSQNSASRTTTLSAPPTPDISLGIQGPATGLHGATLAWTAAVQNVGTGPATGVELRITQPSGQPNLTFTGATCTLVTTYHQCLLGTIAAQASVNVVATLTNAAAVASVIIAGTVPTVTGETNTSQNSASFTTTLSAPPAVDVLISDTFDRPNGSLGNATSGQAWTLHSQPMTIQNGQAAAGDGFVLASIQSPQVPSHARVTMVQTAPEFWLVVRFQNSTNYWRFGRWQSQPYQLQRVVNNNLDLANITTLSTVTPAAGDLLACTLSSGEITCSVNGLSVVRATSTGGNTALGLGLSAYQSNAARFDDFTATNTPGAPPPPDLSISLVSPSSVFTGSPLSWTADVRNQSSQAQVAQVIFTPPASVTQVQIPGFSCTPSGATWVCPLGSIAAGQVVSVRLDAVAPGTTGQIVFSANVPVVAGEVQTTNNTASATTSVNSSGGGGAFLSDTFDRSNATSLGVATSGQTWTTHSGTIAIANGQAAPEMGFALASVDGGGSTLDVQVSLVAPGAEFWLILRFADAQNYWRFGRWQNEPYHIQRIVNNSLGNPSVSTLATVVPAAGDSLRCTTGPTGINCFVNGTPILATSDSGGSTATRVGLSTYQTASVRFDNLSATGPAPVANPMLSVTAPLHVLRGELNTVQLSVRNAGTVQSATGSLAVALPASIVVNSAPAGCTAQGSNYNCAVPALAAAAVQNFAFTLTSNEGTPFSGNAAITVAGDSVTGDNQASWKTFTHVPGSSILDRFNRSNTSSGLGTAPSLQSWTSLAAGFRILNNAARADSAGAFTRIDTGYAFGTIEAVLGANAGTTAIVFRVVDANNYYRLSTDANGFYALRKVINGVASPLALGNTRDFVTPTAGDRVRVITRPDDGVFVAVNDVQIIDMGDQALMYATGWGMASIGGPATVDEFSVNPKIEGYKATDTFSVPDLSNLFNLTSGVKYRWIDWLGPTWRVTGQQAHGTDPGYTLTWVDTTSEQATVQATIANPGTGAWVVFRFDEFSNTYFRFGHNAGTYGVQWMYGYTVNSMPVAVQVLSTPPVQAGDVIQVRQLPDGTVECSVNGTVTHRFVDAITNARWTLYGLAAAGSTPRLDDFIVTPYTR